MGESTDRVEAPGLREAWRRYGERPEATVVVDETVGAVSAERIVREVAALDTLLAERGVTRGARAILQCPNWYEFVALYVAFARRGITTIFLPMTYELGELQQIVDLTEPELVACPAEYRGRTLLEWYGELAWPVGPPQLLLELRPDEGRPRAEPPFPVIPYMRAIGEVGSEPPAWPEDVELEGGAIHLTGGTTGGIKGAHNDASTLNAINQPMIERYGLGPADVVFVPSSASHGVGFCQGVRLGLVSGAPLVFQERWEAGRAAELVAREGCTFVAAATPFLHDVVGLVESSPAGADRFRSLRVFLCGGAPVPRVLRERALQALPSTFVSPLWGMTECGGVTTCPLDSDLSCRLDTDGVPMPTMTVRVVDADGRILPPGETGELQVKGPQVFQGYVNRPDLTAATFTADGFLRTGDAAVMTPGGAVKLVGRFKEIIIRGGVNISPGEIEGELLRHEAIEEVAVVGVADSRLGERIGAACVLAGDAKVTLEELREWLSERGVARFKWPEVIAFVDELPKTPSRKVEKHRLVRELGWEKPATERVR